MKIVKISRRNFLKNSSLLASGLILGSEIPVSANERDSRNQLGSFLQMTNGGKIRIGMPVVEMGQGIYTSLAMCALEELEMDIDQVEHIETILHPNFKNPILSKFTDEKLQVQGTGASTSLKAWGTYFQNVGATAREMLLTAASQHWKIERKHIYVNGISVVNTYNNREISYGMLCDQASKLDVPKIVKTKNSNFKLIGKPIKRWDTKIKINGKAIYGADVRVPGMLYGTVVNPPVLGSKIINVDEKQAKKLSGFISVIPLERQVIVIAKSTWIAMEAANLLEFETEEGLSGLDDQIIEKKLEEDSLKPGITSDGFIGKIEKKMKDSSKILSQTYSMGMQAHAALETLTATASVSEFSCEFWGPVQFQDNPLYAAMQITGLPANKIKVNTTYLGGSFGRKGEIDMVIPPILASKVIGKPVQITWSREAEMATGYLLPPSLNKLSVALSADGMPTALKVKVTSPSASKKFADALGYYFPPWISEDGYDWAAMEGMPQQPSPLTDSTIHNYNIPNIKVEYVPSEIPINFAFWRGIGASANLFSIESMIDEIAYYSKSDSIDFRIKLLRHSPRAINVLQKSRELSNWRKVSPSHYQGVAYGNYLNTIQAHIFEISIDLKNEISIHRITCVLDCGFVNNPNIVKQQVHSGIIWGLTAATKSEINIKDGKIIQNNYDNYKMIRLKDTPRIDFHLINNNEISGGIGEVGTPLVGPAIANAVFAATGKRVRRLPIRKEDLI